MVILKSYSILQNKFIFVLILLSNLFSSSTIDKGDKEFQNKNYQQAIQYYLKSNDITQLEVKLRLIQSYLKLGDNYYKIKEYDSALVYYIKGKKLNSRSADNKIAKVYEKQADLHNKIHEYQQALVLYKKAIALKNTNVIKKIKTIEGLLAHQKKLDKDTRIIVTKDSPKWTHSIGRLIIPTNLEFSSERKYTIKNKKCSATLVNLNANLNSNIIITASHCLSSYNPKAGQIKFIIKSKNQEMIYRIAKVKFDSHFNIKKMKNKTDFAILLLNKKISYNEVNPLIIRKDSFIILQKKFKNHFASLGGFSNDIAEYGANLTYDPNCKLLEYTKMYAFSTCKGFNGASGGAIILTTINERQIHEHHFVGVVSHFKNKDFSNIYFAPHHLFYDKVRKYMKDS